MNGLALAFLVLTAAALMVLPRKWAPVPLLASCCYMTIGQGIDVGPFSLPVYRIVLAVGLLRAMIRRETLAGGVNTIDKLMIAWAGWIVFASFFHEFLPGSGPVYASGFVYNIVLVYFLTRAWCSDLPELMAVLRMMAWLLVPVAIAMVAEHSLHKNYFGVLFGGVSEGVYIRDGAIRAQGPFVHPLLAGTVGAVCFPLLVGIWHRYRFSAVIGLAACLTIVIACTSSGPLMSFFIGVLALVLWHRRHWLRLIRFAFIGVYLCAEVVMERPAYYLISKIDLTGSSTGWHRSRLIERAIEHLSEWWLFGTDRTVHWMGLAVDEAGRHSDITNYYLWVGVVGGLPATLLQIAMMWCAFALVGRAIRYAPAALQQHRFMIWCLGAGLLGHASASLSMGYPDQSMMFFWLNISVISSMYSAVKAVSAMEQPHAGVAAPGLARPVAVAGRAHNSSPPVQRPAHWPSPSRTY
jgi:hypothetical protein